MGLNSEAAVASPLRSVCLFLALPLLIFVPKTAQAIPSQITAAPQWRFVPQGGMAPRSFLVPRSRSPVASPQPSSSASQGTHLPADAQLESVPLPSLPLIRPSLSGGVPVGFVGGWGDYYLAASAGTPGNRRDGAPGPQSRSWCEISTCQSSGHRGHNAVEQKAQALVMATSKAISRSKGGVGDQFPRCLRQPQPRTLSRRPFTGLVNILALVRILQDTNNNN